jgi:DNA-binding NarL/FixJ family response regulator
MGRTTLLRELRSEAAGPVLCVYGVRAERELPLAGLHRMLGPVADRVGMLSGAQAEAVGAALSGVVPDLFPLCCGVFGLITGLAPVLCLVDDAHWLDRETLAVLAFVARRSQGSRIAMVLAGRPGVAELGGVERIVLPPLPDAACAQLLAERLPYRIPAGLRAMLVESTAGNPRDLLELAGGLSPDQLAGRAPLPEELPPGGRQRARYRARMLALSPAAQRVLLCLAAEPALDVEALPGPDVREVVESGLLPLSPAVRATLYAEASDGERWVAHNRLAALLDGEVRTWHLAMTGTGASAGLADDVAAAAARAQRSGEHDLAWRRWERAAQLTVHTGQKADRLLSAATQAWHAGKAGRARALLRQVGPDAALLHGEIELRDGEPTLATHDLSEVAERLADRTQVAVALMLAGEARRIAGDLPGYAEIARRAGDLPVPGDPAIMHLAAAHLSGLAATFAGRHAEAVSLLGQAIRVGTALDDVRSAVWTASAAFALGQAEAAHEHASAAVSRARLAGEPAQLPWAMVYLALSALVLDRHRAAVSAAEQGLAAAISVAQRNCAVQHLTILALAAALRGDRHTTLSHLDAAVPEIADRGLGRPSAIASWAHACLALAEERPADALAQFDAIAAGVGAPQPAVRALATPQLVEAAVACGQRDRALRSLKSFDRWISASGGPHWQALSHRCHALLASDASAEDHFLAAIRLHRRGGAALELARTQLFYAHWLRRARRPGAARDPLRDAARIFQTCGAETYTERARTELRAAGETITSTAPSLEGLTPQQAAISRLVAAGQTNREIARRLVISHRTVDHHLRNIFATLGVRSRVELTRRVATLDAD